MRIVTHTCSNTEIVAALGCGDQIVGVDDHSDYPAALVSNVARIGPDLSPDIERIKALKPDLVITSLTLPGHEKNAEAIHQAGLDYILLEPKRLRDVPANIQAIASAIGAEQAGQELAEQFNQALTPAPKPITIPKILVEWWPKPVIVPTRDSWVNEMLELAGATNPFSELEGKSTPIESAQAIEARPDAIVISWCGVPFEKYRKDVVRRREDWQDIPALENDHIFPISEELLGRPGPRLLQGIEALKQLVAANFNNKS